MAIAFGNRLGESAAGTTTVVVTTGANANVDELLVVWIACDNTGSNLPNLSNIVPSTGAIGAINSTGSHPTSSATAAAATRGIIAFALVTTLIPSGSTLTVSFSAAPAKSIAIAATFTGASTTVACTPSGSSATASPYQSNNAGNNSGATAIMLILGLASCENNAAMTGLAANYTQPGGDGLVNTASGGATANVSMACGYWLLSVANGTGPGSYGAAGASDGGAVNLALAPSVDVYPEQIRSVNNPGRPRGNAVHRSTRW